MPVSGPGKGGKLGTSLTQHIMRSVIKDTMRDEDPREAILRHAEAAAGKCPRRCFVGRASSRES